MLDNDNQNDTTTQSTDPGTTDAASTTADTASSKPRRAPAKRAPRKAVKATTEAPDQGVLGETLPPESSRRTTRRSAPKAAPEAAADASAALPSGTAPDATTDGAPQAATRAPRKATARKAAAAPVDGADAGADTRTDTGDAPAAPQAKKVARKRAAKKAPATAAAVEIVSGQDTDADHAKSAATVAQAGVSAPVLAPPVVLFQPPSEAPASRRRRPTKSRGAETAPSPFAEQSPAADESQAATGSERPRRGGGRAQASSKVTDEADDSQENAAPTAADTEDSAETDAGGGRRRRRRGRRGRGRNGESDSQDQNADRADELDADAEAETEGDADDEDHAETVAEAALSASARRRRRRRRSGGSDAEASGAEDDPPNTVVHVRDGRSAGARSGDADSDGVRGVKGSTRLEAKRQRRRDNRDSGRRRAPILTEAEFLARREAVDRVMAVRQAGDRTQIAVLEDDVLVEHYVTRAASASAVGNVYLGRVQNVLPSMEAAFVDIGRGRNGVLYAGEVNWDASGLEGKSRAIENAMSSGDSVLVQVTKDPIGHKGARLTSQISLPGRFVVYVPGGGMTGISRKLPDTERSRLKSILKKVVPDDAGVIVRTAAEGASEEDLISDVERLKLQWQAISEKAEKGTDGPTLVYGEPDLAIRVVRDVFNDDFKKLIVSGSDGYRTISDYVKDVAPDLADRISLHTADTDLFHDLRVDEQLAKALDRKVWLPSGGSLVIDRTEAMVVIDVNTGKYTGSGGNLEQTVTRNNLEAAEEIVRQLRLRDIGGIVVIDFIDMVLESNRDLVLRRLTECLGRDRTKHQVAEVTSLGLVQMTRKRVGEGLLEAFSEPCEHCKGRGVIVHSEPVERKSAPQSAGGTEEERPARSKRSRKAKTTAPEPEPVSAIDPEKRRAAASAIAAIAAATAHHDDADATAVATSQDGRAEMTIGVVGSVEIDAAVSAAVEAAIDLAAQSADADSESPGQSVREAAVEPVSEAAPDSGSDSVATGAAASPSRPRRRRGASRPAGPPVVSATADGG